ncbi:hypothetical protein CCY99_02465 [Helicobacter sp. 16-1353]|uniref:efflux RND transporter periplasmic adaptor subunit n=1 Tax=Helicobacter sp. 16-1353 TaxID=2004996 RepID=UPI000DCF081C|nr:efflux RND transporter periplasmic adaptor subunit [Helicobacter sp. 16-1353]RAX54646.1 hypothetical protein CCY99_02465 [Helicobacter sp. 16-1353]
MKSIKIIIFFIFTLFFIACGSSEKAQITQEQESPKVAGILVENNDVDIVLEYPARFKSIQQSEVYARVEGILMEQYFKEGALVKKDDLLFKIEPSAYLAEVERLNAEIKSAEANLDMMTRDFNRIEKLYAQKVVTIDVFDTSHFNFRSATARLDSLKASLKNAKLNLAYTEVKAPISGKIGARNIDIGNMVGNGNNILATITQLSPIYADFSIPPGDIDIIRNSDLEDIKVDFILQNGALNNALNAKNPQNPQNLNGSQNPNTALNTQNPQNLGVNLERFKPKNSSGKIDFLDSTLDENTATLRARAIFDNSDNFLIPNEFLQVRLSGLELKNVATIPQTAILQDSNGSFVYVANPTESKESIESIESMESANLDSAEFVESVANLADSTTNLDSSESIKIIKKVYIKIAQRNTSENLAIIESGLNVGDVVVTNNLVKLVEGMQVALKLDSSNLANAPLPKNPTL